MHRRSEDVVSWEVDFVSQKIDLVSQEAGLVSHEMDFVLQLEQLGVGLEVPLTRLGLGTRFALAERIG